MGFISGKAIGKPGEFNACLIVTILIKRNKIISVFQKKKLCL